MGNLLRISFALDVDLLYRLYVVGQAETPLEQEIFRLLHMNEQPVLDPVLTAVEEASLMAMSLEEVCTIFQ